MKSATRACLGTFFICLAQCESGHRVFLVMRVAEGARRGWEHQRLNYRESRGTYAELKARCRSMWASWNATLLGHPEAMAT